VYKKKYKHLQNKIDIVRIIMKNTFILYVFDIVRLHIFNNMFGQTLSSLTLTKPRMQDKNGRKYVESYCKLMYKIYLTLVFLVMCAMIRYPPMILLTSLSFLIKYHISNGGPKLHDTTCYDTSTLDFNCTYENMHATTFVPNYKPL
jgi:hypothetical protein